MRGRGAVQRAGGLRGPTLLPEGLRQSDERQRTPAVAGGGQRGRGLPEERGGLVEGAPRHQGVAQQHFADRPARLLKFREAQVVPRTGLLRRRRPPP